MVTTDVASTRAATNVLDVVAMVSSIVVPPVGALLGLVSRHIAKAHRLPPSAVSTAAIVVGTLVTGVAVLFLLAPLLAPIAFLG